MVIDPNDGDEQVTHCVTQPCRPQQHEGLKSGLLRWTQSKTNTVIRTANTPSENALSRSGVSLLSMDRVARSHDDRRRGLLLLQKLNSGSTLMSAPLILPSVALSLQKFADRLGDFTRMRFQSEMTGVEGQVAFVSLRPCGQEERVIAAPDRQKPRPMLS